MKSPSYIPGSGRSWVQRAILAIALVFGAYLIFEFGRIQAKYNVVDAISEQQALLHEIEDLENRIVVLKQEIALLETHQDIDREAYQVVEANLGELQKKIQEQRDAIAFYRGIVSPADGGRGLRVQDLKLTKGKDERQYHVRLVLVQVMQHDRSVKGEVDFSIEGAQDGIDVTYALEQLLPAEADSNWPFSFRYFQDFDRELVLPAGFTPEKINIEVISRTKSIASVKQSFLWGTGQS
jgi:cell division protein FtsB